MADQRLKGQEIEVLLVADGVVQDTITDVRSFEVGLQLEILREGYLGETTDRRDSIFRGVTGRMELHFENQDILDLAQAIVDKARRRTPGFQINIKATLNFPNGDRPRVVIPNAEFGELPFTAGSRADYLGGTLNFEAEGFQVI